MSPQHEADHHAKRKGGSKRPDRSLGYDAFEIFLLLAQGFAELVERRLDLIGERLGAIPGGVEDALAPRVQEARYVAFERFQLVPEFVRVEHRSCPCCIIQPKF